MELFICCCTEVYLERRTEARERPVKITASTMVPKNNHFSTPRLVCTTPEPPKIFESPLDLFCKLINIISTTITPIFISESICGSCFIAKFIISIKRLNYYKDLPPFKSSIQWSVHREVKKL